MEAAGVEPASENTSSQITTCVSPFSCRNRLETEPSAPVAIPDISHRHASERNVATSLGRRHTLQYDLGVILGPVPSRAVISLQLLTLIAEKPAIKGRSVAMALEKMLLVDRPH